MGQCFAADDAMNEEPPTASNSQRLVRDRMVPGIFGGSFREKTDQNEIL